MVTYKFSHKIVSEYMGKKYIYTCPSEKLKYTFHVNNDSGFVSFCFDVYIVCRGSSDPAYAGPH